MNKFSRSCAVVLGVCVAILIAGCDSQDGHKAPVPGTQDVGHQRIITFDHDGHRWIATQNAIWKNIAEPPIIHHPDCPCWDQREGRE
jgi:hypothetical protein